MISVPSLYNLLLENQKNVTFTKYTCLFWFYKQETSGQKILFIACTESKTLPRSTAVFMISLQFSYLLKIYLVKLLFQLERVDLVQKF